MKKIVIIIFVLIILTIGYIFYQVNIPKVVMVSFESKKIKQGEAIKILQISDVHNKKFSKDNQNIVNKIKDLQPDIIVFTGDLIDGKTIDYTNTLSMVEKIVDINPYVYYVCGNHEWRNSQREQLLKDLEDLEVKILNNDNETISIRDISINICGVDDPYTYHDNVEAALEDIHSNIYTILLAHAPDIITRKHDLLVDLILSGHTHGGQIRVPFIGALVAPGQGFFPTYDKGVYEIGAGRKLYIDSGLGTSTLPIRFLNRSQMSLITIQSQ